MKQLVLHFSETRLQILKAAAPEPLHSSLSIDFSKPFAREHLTTAIKEALIDHSLRELIWFGADYTLFPIALFDPSQLTNYYELNHGKADPNCHLCYQLIENAGIAVIFSIPVWLYDYSKYELQAVRIKHAVGQQIQYSLLQSHQSQVSVFIEEKHFVMLASQNGKLLSATTNAYQQVADVLYFLLAQQQKLQLPTPLSFVVYDSTTQFNKEELLGLLKQFKDFEHYLPQFQDCTHYQKHILCASLEVH